MNNNDNSNQKLYFFKSGDESIVSLVSAESEEEAIKLVNERLSVSDEMFNRSRINKGFSFDKTFMKEFVQINKPNSVIIYHDAYTF